MSILQSKLEFQLFHLSKFAYSWPLPFFPPPLPCAQCIAKVLVPLSSISFNILTTTSVGFYILDLRLSLGCLPCSNFCSDDFIMPTFHSFMCRFMNTKYLLLILFHWISHIYRQLPTQNLHSRVSLAPYTQNLKTCMYDHLILYSFILADFPFWTLFLYFAFFKWKLTSCTEYYWQTRVLRVFLENSLSSTPSSEITCVLSQFIKSESYCYCSEQPSVKQGCRKQRRDTKGNWVL